MDFENSGLLRFPGVISSIKACVIDIRQKEDFDFEEKKIDDWSKSWGIQLEQITDDLLAFKECYGSWYVYKLLDNRWLLSTLDVHEMITHYILLDEATGIRWLCKLVSNEKNVSIVNQDLAPHEVMAELVARELVQKL